MLINAIDEKEKNPLNVNLSIKSYEVRIICYNRARRYTYFCKKLYIILTMKNIFCFLTLLLSLGVNAQITERTLPAEWKHLIDGGRFKDRFLPMPDGKSGENVWGTDSVRLRYVDNGIENPELSFGEETFSKVRITNTISLSADGRKTRLRDT